MSSPDTIALSGDNLKIRLPSNGVTLEVDHDPQRPSYATLTVPGVGSVVVEMITEHDGALRVEVECLDQIGEGEPAHRFLIIPA